jgi:predicted dehydrogenase
MNNKKIRLAVLGCGPRWLGLASIYMQHPDLDVVAVCDIADGAAEESARQLKENFGCEPAVFTSYEAMRDNACYDAIFIACDPDIQVDYAVAEMERGIHVMTEVPAALLGLNKGCIREGADADLIVFNEQIQVSDVFVGGQKVI